MFGNFVVIGRGSALLFDEDDDYLLIDFKDFFEFVDADFLKDFELPDDDFLNDFEILDGDFL